MKNINLIALILSTLLTVSCVKTETDLAETKPTLLVSLEHNAENDILIAKVSGGLKPYSYDWHLHANTDSLPNSIIDPNPGDYTLTVTDANMAKVTITKRIHGLIISYCNILIDNNYANFDIESVSLETGGIGCVIGENGAYTIRLSNGMFQDEIYRFSNISTITSKDLKEKHWQIQLNDKIINTKTSSEHLNWNVPLDERGYIVIKEYVEDENNRATKLSLIFFNAKLALPNGAGIRTISGRIDIVYF